MAPEVKKLSIELKFKDIGSQAVIQKLRGSLKTLEMGVSGVRPNIKGLRDEILSQGRASVKSVSNINAQLAALKALRDEARIGGKAFNTLTADIEKLDTQMRKSSKRTKGRGGKALATTQIAGAVVSGGIFGGPEGAVGALGGAALGGVPGSFAGAAIGAQVGGIRQILGEFADYAAQIAKLEIALEGISGSQGEFNKALNAARDVTEQLNVPQEVAIQGITRLTAAVKGAGGQVADAELAFKNINSAIIATGGGSEEVQGAVTALVQIFSKGKVSAEEINQIAERLPGTFNKIAKASGRTGPELTKALQQGQVGLNDLTKFLVSLGDEYGDLALKIARSSENAGARLQVAFNDLRIEVGEALQPIGAEFQNTFKEFIETIAPALVEVLPKIGKVALEVGKNLDVLAAAALAASAAMGAIAAQAAIIKAGSIAALFNKIAVAATAAGVATKGMSAAVLLNPYVALAAGVTVATVGVIKYYKHQEKLNGILDEGKASTSALKDKIQEYKDSIVKVDSKLKGINGEQKVTGRNAHRLKKQINELKGELERLEGTYNIRLSYEDRGFKFDEKGQLKEFTVGGNVYDAESRRFLRKETPDLTEYPGTEQEDDSSKKALERRRDAAAEIVRKLGEALNLSKAQNEVEKLLAKQSKDRSDLQAKFKKLQKDGVDAKIQQQQEEAEELLLQKQRVELTTQTNKLYQKTLDDITKITDKIKEKFQSDKEYQRLLAEGISPELAKQLVAINQQFAAGDKLLKQRILHLRTQLKETGLSDQEIENIKEQIRLIEEKRKLLGEAAEQATQDATTFTKDKSNFEIFKESFKAGIEEMGNIYENLGTAAANAFSGMADTVADFVTTGSAKFKEFAASVLSDLSKIFIRFAFFQALKALNPGLFGLEPVPNTAPVGYAANGLAFGKNGIVPYAKGGIVNKPTLFQYASGGAGRFGLMGEAGPEAIMPLRRGRNGKLGVESSGSVGNVVVNVDASGSSVQGSQPNAKALGKAIGAVVQAELIKQKRPGGILA